jgi:hypothetical protein
MSKLTLAQKMARVNPFSTQLLDGTYEVYRFTYQDGKYVPSKTVAENLELACMMAEANKVNQITQLIQRWLNQLEYSKKELSQTYQLLFNGCRVRIDRTLQVFSTQPQTLVNLQYVLATYLLPLMVDAAPRSGSRYHPYTVELITYLEDFAYQNATVAKAV